MNHRVQWCLSQHNYEW